MAEIKSEINFEERESMISWKVMLTTFLAVIAGVWLAAVIIPMWLPGMVDSILGEDTKVFWYLSRGSAIIAYVLLWFSMILGLLMTNRLTRLWPGPAVSNEFHEFISILGLAFVLVHAFILMGDPYIHYQFLQVLVPFTSFDYRPFWVGLGQIGFYLWFVLVISFYVRKKIGTRTWRLLHFFSFIAFLGAMVHGIASGTDTAEPWMRMVYWVSAGSTLFLVIYRILLAVMSRMLQPARKTAS